MQTKPPYDPTSPSSIERYAKRLVGHSLREMLVEESTAVYQTGKGRYGDIVERSYFGISPGNISAPDFAEAGVELKTTPLKRVGKRLRAKERLVLQMIDYMAVHRETWETSSFLKKNSRLMLLFYLWEQDADVLDYVFKIARLWSFPEADLKIIRNDWEKIVGKIRAGKADGLSEGDTLYLAACTKAATAENRRDQPFSAVRAKPRAFSLKASYMNSVIDESLKLQSAVSVDELRTGRTFEEVVHDRFRPYIGMTADEIADALGVTIQRGAKNLYAVLTSRVLGVDVPGQVAEFRKAGITSKTMRLKPNGMPKEAVSFCTFKFLELVLQDWEESDLRFDLTRRFFFVVYQLDATGVPTLVRTQFWTMPVEDVDIHGRECFERTVKATMDDRPEDFPRSTDNKVCHVRPHGQNKADTLPMPSGRQETKRSFWLNQRYLATQLRDRRDT